MTHWFSFSRRSSAQTLTKCSGTRNYRSSIAHLCVFKRSFFARRWRKTFNISERRRRKQRRSGSLRTRWPMTSQGRRSWRIPPGCTRTPRGSLSSTALRTTSTTVRVCLKFSYHSSSWSSRKWARCSWATARRRCTRRLRRRNRKRKPLQRSWLRKSVSLIRANKNASEISNLLSTV